MSTPAQRNSRSRLLQPKDTRQMCNNVMYIISHAAKTTNTWNMHIASEFLLHA